MVVGWARCLKSRPASLFPAHDLANLEVVGWAVFVAVVVIYISSLMSRLTTLGFQAMNQRVAQHETRLGSMENWLRTTFVTVAVVAVGVAAQLFYMQRTAACGGFYWAHRQGMSLGGPLSPMIGAFYLAELDEGLERLGCFWVRFMDDIAVLTPTPRVVQVTLAARGMFVTA